MHLPYHHAIFITYLQMCWSADTSILSFIVGCLGIVLATFKGFSPFMILFFSTIVAMQLVEYVVWTYGDNPNANFAASIAAASLLALQPIASILTISQSYIPVTAYLILAFFAHMLDNDSRPLQERYKITPEPHLVWHWLTPPPLFSLLIYFFFLLTPLILSKNFVLLGIVLASLAFSIISYTHTWGSIWCYAIHSIVLGLCFAT